MKIVGPGACSSEQDVIEENGSTALQKAVALNFACGAGGKMRAGFRIIDHTADKAIEVWAADIGRLIEEAARGLTALLVEARGLQPVQWLQISSHESEPEILLHDILAQMLHLVEDESLVPVQVRSGNCSPGTATLEIGVVPIARATEHLHSPIKAVTYHNLEIVQDTAGLLRTQIVFDT